MLALKAFVLSLTVALVLAVESQDPGWHIPEQTHIAIGEHNNQMIVVWTTFNDTADTTVKYGADGEMTMKKTGRSTKFTDTGPEQRFMFIHHAVLKNLKANTNYTYHVGSDSHGYSKSFSFVTWPPLEQWSPSLLVYGDLGLSNAQSWPALQRDAATGDYHAIIHVGDLAYDLDAYNARTGDSFMNMIEPLAATMPYMTCPGNHESAGNFSNYRSRFYMPGDYEKKMYYSFNMGPAHFISMSTEAWYYDDVEKTVGDQYEWLENDLSEAANAWNRTQRPWIIVFGHRPMYCSNNNHDDCTGHDSKVRSGDPDKNIPGVERLFNQYGVDLIIWGHEHDYERLWPVYDHKIYNGSSTAPYTNPGAPVHVITGSAGCYENHDSFPDEVTNPLSAFHSDDYGYMRMKIHNNSHIYMEQMSIDKNDVLDELWLIKDKHGPYNCDSPFTRMTPTPSTCKHSPNLA